MSSGHFDDFRPEPYYCICGPEQDGSEIDDACPEHGEGEPPDA